MYFFFSQLFKIFLLSVSEHSPLWVTTSILDCALASAVAVEIVLRVHCCQKQHRCSL